MKKLIALLAIVLFYAQMAWAQCAMCKAGAETSVEAGNTQAAGINTGVLYILFFVFVFFSFFVFIALKGKKYFE
ncbi:MAG: hypothetical protein KDE33_16920 [Bacteroidetes bacterium]|nr:hypothetical protein [Bacteroidota bacterium]MCB9226540.1 hypothetical protein [Chitinophagales bacterium]